MIAVFLRASVLRLVLVGVVTTAMSACGQQGTGAAEEESSAVAKASNASGADPASDDDKNAASEREAKRSAAAKARRANAEADAEPVGKASVIGGKTTLTEKEA
ncbi:MAG: hypothetical protein IT428_21320, partial [Planctomycetaceae bacterium]|nr:hypothetical protein [Planctomycetaceae bacterium]